MAVKSFLGKVCGTVDARGNAQLKQIAVRFSDNQFDAINEIAKKKNIPFAEVVRRFVELGLAK